MPSRPLVLALWCAALSFALPARAQNDPVIPSTPAVDPSEPPADTDLGKPGIKVSPKVYTPLFWSPGTGFGLGVGADVKNLGLVGSTLVLQVAPAQHRGQYGVWYQTKSPYGPGLSALGGAFYETNENFPYYGVGPTSSETDKIHLFRHLFESEGRVTYGFGEQGHLRAGGFARYQKHSGIRTEDVEAGARGRLSARSEQALQASLDDPKALAVGAEAYYDTRSNLFNPRAGMLAQVGTMRTSPLGETNFNAYWQRYGTLNYYLPLGLESTLLARVIVIDSDARDGTPSVLLPVLDSGIGAGMDRHRFVANDIVYLSAQYSKVLFDFGGFVAADGVLSGHLYGAYDRLSQFTPSITLDRTLDPTRDRYPLRPAVGVGVRLYSYFLESTLLNVTLGFSREKLGLQFFNVTADLRSPRPFLRGR